jgi:hypothetical protein
MLFGGKVSPLYFVFHVTGGSRTLAVYLFNLEEFCTSTAAARQWRFVWGDGGE